MHSQELTQQQLQDALWYCSATGRFFWRFDGGPPQGGGSWSIKAGDPAGRQKIKICGTLYQAHHLAWLYTCGAFPDGMLFHIDGDLTNNRIGNLQLKARNGSAPSQPRQHDVTQCPGVTWSPRDNKWLANITSNGKKKYLGLFTDHADAVTARKAAEVLRQIPAPPAAALPTPPPHLPTPLW
jgi:hypothetical protein